MPPRASTTHDQLQVFVEGFASPAERVDAVLLCRNLEPRMPARWQDYAMENPKEALREKLQSLRPRSSAGLTEQLRKLVEKLSPANIASYQPMAAEPDTSEFNAWAEGRFQLVYPRVIGETLEFAPGPLSLGRFGISEPMGKRVDQIDLVLVPALAIDRKGNRLGKGKGFYDRFLPGFDGIAYAVVFDEEVLDTIPVEEHDQTIAGVITPNRTIVFD
jgi:5-formyltetrahydrofolate cyclo-ligase